MAGAIFYTSFHDLLIRNSKHEIDSAELVAGRNKHEGPKSKW